MSALRLTTLLPDHTDPGAATLADRARDLTDPLVLQQRQLLEAHAAGYAEGVTAARAQLADEAQQTAQLFAAAVTEATARVEDAAVAAVRADATDLAQAAWSLARWALGRELAADPTALTEAVEAALAEVDVTASLTAYAHPDTLASLRAWAAGYGPQQLTLTPDPLLAPGEIRVVATTGARVEATVTEIGRRALARLVGTVAATDTGSPEPQP